MLAGVSKILGEATPEPVSLEKCARALAILHDQDPDYMARDGVLWKAYIPNAIAVLDAAGVDYVN
jgi:hypothetical protein